MMIFVLLYYFFQGLEGQHDQLCRQLQVEDMAEVIGWSAKVHWDKVQKNSKEEQRFADLLCEVGD